MTGNYLVKRVVLENYKSIAACDVRLEPLTFLVGPNGSGKSNFLDALSFVADALNHSLGQALQKRGGGAQICHATHLNERSFRIRLEFVLPDGGEGHYDVRVGLPPDRGDDARWEVLAEECVAPPISGEDCPTHYRLHDGWALEANFEGLPVLARDRLYLVDAAGRADFRRVFDALSNMRFYQIQAGAVEDLGNIYPEQALNPDGGNLVGVLTRLSRYYPLITQRINDYLRVILPGLIQVSAQPISSNGENLPSAAPKAALVFEQAGPGGAVHRFWASQMSDGTRRALGILAALLQGMVPNDLRPSLVGIEEPEAQVNPAVMRVLLDAMSEASLSKQVLVTTHSPDLLDDTEVTAEGILAVAMEGGRTLIGPVDEAGRAMVRDSLYTVGELLRIGQLTPEVAPANGLVAGGAK